MSENIFIYPHHLTDSLAGQESMLENFLPELQAIIPLSSSLGVLLEKRKSDHFWLLILCTTSFFPLERSTQCTQSCEILSWCA